MTDLYFISMGHNKTYIMRWLRIVKMKPVDFFELGITFTSGKYEHHIIRRKTNI